MIESKQKRRQRIIISIIFIILGYLLPIIFLHNHTYAFAILITIGIFSIAAIGLNILVGYCGLLNLGFAGFLCIGAYTSAILMKAYGFNFWTAVSIAVIHSAIWGVLLGVPLLGLSGDYFAIATFGFSELVVLVAKNWQSLTGGTRGYPDVPRPEINLTFLQKFGIFSDTHAESLIYKFQVLEKTPYWILIFSFIVISLIITRRLIHSRLGRAWIALREDDIAANACGVDERVYKTIAFAVSAGFGGLAGALQAAYLANVDWHNFTFMISIFILCYLVLGGMGTLLGPVVGTAVLISLSEFLRTQLETHKLNPDLRFIFYGLILIIVIRFRPQGLILSWKVKPSGIHPERDDPELIPAEPPDTDSEIADE